MVGSASRSSFLFEHEISSENRISTHRVKARGQAFRDHALTQDLNVPMRSIGGEAATLKP